MAGQYAVLKAAIEAVIKTNGNNEITGALMQQSLLAMITSLGAYYDFVDVATPSTNPGTPDQNVMYFAATAGTYTNFGGIVVNEGEFCALCWNGSWVKKTTGAATAEQVAALGQKVDDMYPKFPNVENVTTGVVIDGLSYTVGHWNNNGGVIQLVTSTGDDRAYERVNVQGHKRMRYVTMLNSSYSVGYFTDADGNILQTIAYGGAYLNDASVDIPAGAVWFYGNFLKLSNDDRLTELKVYFVTALSKNEQDYFARTIDDTPIIPRWKEEDFFFGFDDASGNPIRSTTGIYLKDPIPVVPGSTFGYYTDANAARCGFSYYKEDGTFIQKAEWYSGSGTLTLPNNCGLMRPYVIPKSGSTTPQTLATSGFYITLNKHYVPVRAVSANDVNNVETRITSRIDYSLTKGKQLNDAGDVTDTAGRYTTMDYIPVYPGQVLHIHTARNFSNIVFLATYDENKNLVAVYKSSGVSYSNARDLTITTERYIRFSTNEPKTLLYFVTPANINQLISQYNPVDAIPIVAPSPQLPADGTANADFDAETLTPAQLDSAFADLIAGIPIPSVGNRYSHPSLTKCTKVGRDATNTYDINSYLFTKRNRFAWKHADALFAWKNGGTIVYTDSVSPRVGDSVYSNTSRTSTGYAVTSYNSTTQSFVSNGVTYTKSTADNVDADVVFTTEEQSRVSLQNREVFNRANDSLGTSTATDATHLTINSKSYERCTDFDYHTGQRGTIFIWGNEHGPQSDPAECAIVIYRLAKDLCVGCRNNPFLLWLKENFRIVLLPCANPYGLANHRRNNGNDVNINRNYNTPGWASQSDSDKGSYAGDQPETQYIMNTCLMFGSAIAIDCHCLSYTVEDNNGRTHYEGYIPSEAMLNLAIDAMVGYSCVCTSYGDAQPDSNAWGGSWLYYQGISGGLLEMNPGPYAASFDGKQHSAHILEADYTLLLVLLRMWIYGFDPTIALSDVHII